MLLLLFLAEHVWEGLGRAAEHERDALLAFGVRVGQRTVHPMMRFHSFIDRLVSVVRQSKQREIKRGGTAQREK